MKDLPTTWRLAILVALLLSSAFILSQLLVGSLDGQRFEIVSNSGEESGGKSVLLPPMPDLYPPVPVVLPGLNDGYLFNRDRKFEEVEVDTAGSGSGAVDFAEVSYVGSLIVGEMRKGLITYREKVPVVRRSSGSRRQKSSVKTGYKHKQLTLGKKFMGYIVDKIEKDRIVFKKGDDVVEKFLYDPSKERAVAGSGTKTQSRKLARAIPKSVRQNVQQTPTRRTVTSGGAVSRKKTVANSRMRLPSSGSRTSSAAKVSRSRSERLLGLDPSQGMSPSSGILGDPLRR